MKAEEAYKISVEHANLLDHVEKEISKDVEESAKSGYFAASVEVHYFDDLPVSLYKTFAEKVVNAVEELGYKVDRAESFCDGLMMRISWKD